LRSKGQSSGLLYEIRYSEKGTMKMLKVMRWNNFPAKVCWSTHSPSKIIS